MLSKGTLDALMEIGWVKIRGRKRTPGRPVTYGTTDAFLVQFGLESVSHLPGLDELKAAGFLEAIRRPASMFRTRPTNSARTRTPTRRRGGRRSRDRGPDLD